MSSTNKTPNYGLPQYIGTDKPTYLGDFNDAMGIIDKGMNDNKNAAGEGSNKMDEANARIGDAEESLTETQNQVDSISGLAETIEAKVQTALTQANDAATKSGQANTNSTAAVNAANQASTDANAALQQAQGNVSQINGLAARVTALEGDTGKILFAGSLQATSSDYTNPGHGNFDLKNVLPDNYQNITTAQMIVQAGTFKSQNSRTDNLSIGSETGWSYTYTAETGILSVSGIGTVNYGYKNYPKEIWLVVLKESFKS